MLSVVQIVLWTTIIFLLRKRKQVEPVWSWLRTLGGFLVLALATTAISLIPVVGRFVALAVSIIGIKRLSGLDIPTTLFLWVCVAISMVVLAWFISQQLQVELLDLRN
jgi:hypothetical protein